MKQTQKKERKRDKKTNTHWSYILLALILNFFGIVSFNLHNFLSWPCYPSDGITEAEESK